jgi:hypothetical protein
MPQASTQIRQLFRPPIPDVPGLLFLGAEAVPAARSSSENFIQKPGPVEPERGKPPADSRDERDSTAGSSATPSLIYNRALITVPGPIGKPRCPGTFLQNMLLRKNAWPDEHHTRNPKQTEYHLMKMVIAQTPISVRPKPGAG